MLIVLTWFSVASLLWLEGRGQSLATSQANSTHGFARSCPNVGDRIWMAALSPSGYLSVDTGLRNILELELWGPAPAWLPCPGNRTRTSGWWYWQASQVSSMCLPVVNFLAEVFSRQVAPLGLNEAHTFDFWESGKEKHTFPFLSRLPLQVMLPAWSSLGSRPSERLSPPRLGSTGTG